MQADPVIRVLGALEREGVRYAVFGAVALNAQRLPFEGLLVTVVTPRQLYLMKKNTLRPKDRMDAEALRRRFALEDD
jgi:hypothetical protein